MRTLIAVTLIALSLTACTAGGGATVYNGAFSTGPLPGESRCDNYARQTYWNAMEDRYDPEDGFLSSAMNEPGAQRAADIAYQRCLQGRLN
ncbi:hypothetical protein FPY71_15300 [Aureimonas fodinaquatilis]|uniref:Lipoprotein n=1 Tax=Aureimonas fodinaquatilis TaxID=2565783 RepID=A0A5B0DUP5_9HYPH|nr:hypothetical protein [Aureimonas fodinaquatilis]KAA0968929.1 hypothetical protein FPY71_15300 [Aureimonas fodinaquatilis]